MYRQSPPAILPNLQTLVPDLSRTIRVPRDEATTPRTLSIVENGPDNTLLITPVVAINLPPSQRSSDGTPGTVIRDPSSEATSPRNNDGKEKPER